MKILIADDESLARATLRSMLHDVQVPLEVLPDATNGEEMVTLVQRHTPDIVFVDIKMPKLNGLEAIKQAKAFALDARWFILTGFSEFTYAQEALRLGVSDYLLKPVDPEEVGRVVMEVMREQKKRLFATNQQFERDLAALYHGLTSLKQEDPDSLLMKAHFLGAIFYSDSYLMEAQKAQRQSDFLRDVQTEVNQFLADTIRIALYGLPSGEIALVGAWRAVQEAQGELRCRRCLCSVQELLARYSDKVFCVTMLQTSVCRSYDELYERLNWLQEYAALRSVYGIGRKIHVKTLAEYAAQRHFVAISHALEKLIAAYREKLYVQYMQAIEDLIQRMAGGPAIDSGTKKSVAQFLCHTLPCHVTPDQGSDEWKRILQECGDKGLLAQPRREQRDIVAQVKEFIEQNYPSDISITQIAETLQVTPNYLSALFHKRMGITFIKYLTKIRLLRAKELLADPAMRVQQVAELVGYTGTRHFTKLFTSYFGYYPSEQRKQVTV
ncbi:MAG TPA: response regulator [Ktedonobacterales bacterium]